MPNINCRNALSKQHSTFDNFVTDKGRYPNNIYNHIRTNRYPQAELASISDRTCIEKERLHSFITQKHIHYSTRFLLSKILGHAPNFWRQPAAFRQSMSIFCSKFPRKLRNSSRSISTSQHHALSPVELAAHKNLIYFV